MNEPINLKGYATDPDRKWHYPPDSMPPMGVKLHILTIGGTATHGHWRWDGGFLAWESLPVRDLEAEERATFFINNGELKHE